MIDFKIYTSCKELSKAWNSLSNNDIFLQPHYFKALEEAAPKNISLYYIGIYKSERLVGIAAAQRVQLYLKDIFRSRSSSAFKQFLKDALSKVLKGNILVVGNLTHTGQHGLFFIQNSITQTQFLNEIFKAIETLKIEIKQLQKKKIRAILFKDYFEDDGFRLEAAQFNSKQFHKVRVQPNMIMKVQPHWLMPEDYIADLNKKYKARYKRAKTKFGTIVSREMDAETINNSTSEMYQLYKNVSDNAKFNTFILPKNHFYSLKTELNENFRVFGYYLNNELVGFYTLILNSKTLETYFLGYDTVHQYLNQLYLNMLFDMVNFAIKNKFTSIVYARTAMEIKSSVGGKPEPMFMYMKHTNSILNAILKQIFNLMNPSRKWKERHPFKV